ncbi:MAG: PAS domain S-box protein [Fibrobacteres bacterium]|nr:PAS domain S-box protein [Fibrobacterota bacterium]
MAGKVVLTALPTTVEKRIASFLNENGFSVEKVRNREGCQEELLNSEVLAVIIHESLLRSDSRLIEVMKFYSSSVQFVVYLDAGSNGEGIPARGEIIGYLRGPEFEDDLLGDYLSVAVRLQALEKKIESLNFTLQDNHSVSSELNIKNKVLERERNFNESIISSIAYGLMITDTEGTVMMLNDAGRKIFAVASQDVYGQNYETIVADTLKESLLSNATAALSSGSTKEVEGYAVSDQLTISYSIAVIRDSFRNVIGLLFLGRDITEWNMMTQQLFQAEKLATMGTMLSGIAHELRNPVTIINARAQRLLTTGETLDEKQVKAVESIEHQSRRMGEIVNNLLDFSRRKVTGYAVADINEIIEAALSFIALEGRDKGVEIERNFTQGCITKCDKNQMEQVFLNLFSNACDAMPNGGKLIITTEISADNIRISVRDTGTGIPEELKKKIFDPFFTTKDAGKGTGLGLAIVYKMIQMHKGRLVVRSTVGEGTTFIILLPLNN